MAGAGMDLLTVCVDVSKFIMPHLLLVLSIEWLEKKQREANPPGMFKLINMPNDNIVDILMRLPLKSLCCLRCVSKTCLDMVDSPTFTTLHRERLLKFSSNDYSTAAAPEVPQLVELQYYMRCIQWHQLKLNVNKGSLTRNPLPFSMMYMMDTVDFVFCNLFFFKRSEFAQEFVEAIFPKSYIPNSHNLVDPLRGEFLKIPDCPTKNMYLTIKKKKKNMYLVDWFGMGFDNTTNTYKIVCVLGLEGMQESHATTAHIYELGTHSSSWREIRSVPAGGLSKKNVCAYGDMHWLVKRGSHANIAGEGSRIISFDFKTEEFTWTPHPTLEGLYEDCHLLNIKGSMAMVDTSASRGGNIHIWVMKSYHKKEWASDYKINTKTLAGYPERGFRNFFCYEWEHGIALHDGRTCYFLDLRYKSMNYLEAKSGGFKNIYSFIGSLVSLKNL